MWHALRLPSAAGLEINRELDPLREDALRLFLDVSAAGYVGWLLLSTYFAPPADAPLPWVTFPPAALCYAGTRTLLRRDFRLAVGFLLPSAVVTITIAVWLLGSTLAVLLYPIVAVLAAIWVRPIAGLLVAVGSSALVGALWQSGSLPVLGQQRLVESVVVSVLSVVAVWTLGRSLITAVEWSLHSYEQALNSAREAQTHRGKLVRALRQLDAAYYQLQQANAALEVAWKAAETAERSKSEFVTNLSHELRTPLNLIVGFGETIVNCPELYGEPLPPRYRIDLNAINRSAQHLLALTEDVIDLARVGADQLALAREPVEIAQTVQDAVAIIREYVEVKGLWLRLEIAPDLPLLSIDRLRIRQVLLNLLTNAARFTEHGGIGVKASLDDGSVLVEVIDTGRGIPPGQIERVFSEFYHDADETTRATRSFGGVGLGLPISKRLVELHGGQMGVTSTVDVGTTFWFSLPTVATDGVASAENWRPARKIRAGSAVERAIVLWLADRALARFLQHHLHGWRVMVGRDRQEVRDLATEYHALAVLSDHDQTDLDETRAEADETVSVPILRLPRLDGQGAPLPVGASAYLVKPVTRSDLRAAIAGRLGSTRSVLVVDDDPRFTQLMTRLLHGLGEGGPKVVHGTNSGREALALMGVERPDVVFLDLVMPEMGGQEVYRAMRASPQLADVPVVFVSAQSQFDDQTVFRGPLALERPEGFRLRELLDSVEALLVRLQGEHYPESRRISGTG